jgi:hypothetical protein
MICYGIVTDYFLGRAVPLRINAPNLILYNTHGVGDEGDNPFKKIIFIYFIQKYIKYFCYFIRIFLIIFYLGENIIIIICY